MARTMDAPARLDASRAKGRVAPVADKLRLSRARHSLRADRRHDHGDIADSKHRERPSRRTSGRARDTGHGSGAGGQSLRRKDIYTEPALDTQLHGSHKAAQASASYGDGRWKNQQPADIHIDAASDVRRARPVQSWRAREQETPHLQCRGAGVE